MKCASAALSTKAAFASPTAKTRAPILACATHLVNGEADVAATLVEALERWAGAAGQTGRRSFSTLEHGIQRSGVLERDRLLRDLGAKNKP
jgi:hypothetical protein